MTGSAEVTRAGDVIVLADGANPRAGVDYSGGAVVGSPLQIVRPLPDALDPAVIAALITLHAPKYAVGSTVKHVDLQALELPYPDLATARWLSQALGALGGQRRQAAAMVKALDDLRADLVEGLCSGTLRLPPDTTDRAAP